MSGFLTPNFKKAIIDDILDSMISNTAHYYAFASLSSEDKGGNDDSTHDIDHTYHNNNWNMIFGKKIANTNLMPVILNNVWGSGNVYASYDNRYNANNDITDFGGLNILNPDMPNTFFYVVRQIDGPSSDYAIFKCIDNANNSPSVAAPDLLINSTFTKKEDGYKWRWITTIKYEDYQKYSTDGYIPVYPTSDVTSEALENSSIDRFVIENSGSGYVSYSMPLNINTIKLNNVEGGNSSVYAFDVGDYVYQVNTSSNEVIATGYVYGIDVANATFMTIQVKIPDNNSQFSSNNSYPIYSVRDGVDNRDNFGYVQTGWYINAHSENSKNKIQSISNSTVLQVENYESLNDDFYALNGIYIYNTTTATSQLRNITNYVANSSGKWVYLDQPANTLNIIPGATQYQISPRVKILSDGATDPLAYSVVNTMNNSIEKIVVIEPGSEISWANVTIVSNGIFGTGANVSAIVPPPGGHGSSPATELYVQGFCVSFNYGGTEDGKIPTSYSTNPTEYNIIGIIKNPKTVYANGMKGSTFSGDYFDNAVKLEVDSPVTFSVNSLVIGKTSGSVGKVLFSNTTWLYLIGDKSFIDQEYILSDDGISNTSITINTLGDIYTKDIQPIYYKTINKVSRADDKSESFKLVIQI